MQILNLKSLITAYQNRYG